MKPISSEYPRAQALYTFLELVFQGVLQHEIPTLGRQPAYSGNFFAVPLSQPARR
jgi:hypothetical protein